MYKLLLMVLLSAVIMSMFALQADEEVALHTLFRGKHALNRAVHAAAQQSDQSKLARGIPAIDESKAKTAALQYLQANLRLDAANDPLPGTFLQQRVEVEVFKIVNDGEVFPYTYTNPVYGYSVTLERPGVIMFIRLNYPRTYTIMQPITWTIKGSAEMVF
ncbi:hypothetical protein ACFPES_32240 [Paenibacillus sp. GCM10023248]|uniref:hypothetical protein n=1 Tax=Bacillales TaxID=1385 RepID=UPI002379C1DF|nr:MULTISPECIES: hypothetical protein [Bacillales]MDD9271713.1 hypothetical protein [Paenibacillus sp. MAHUQ-63]MDR6884604.1 hypothetical protein [Bacillus sp. 3255]